MISCYYRGHLNVKKVFDGIKQQLREDVLLTEQEELNRSAKAEECAGMFVHVCSLLRLKSPLDYQQSSDSIVKQIQDMTTKVQLYSA